MTRTTPFPPVGRATLGVAAIIVAGAVLGDFQARAVEIACRENGDFIVEVDGEYPRDAQFYSSDTNGMFLVDIPSRSETFLLDLQVGQAFPVPRAGLRRETIDGTLRVRVPGRSDGSGSRLAVDSAVMAFQADTSKVRVVKAFGRPPDAGSRRTRGPAPEGAPARSCLRIESRPVVGIPGCGRYVHLVNTCDDYVAAQVGRVEHLFSGPLPQTFSVIVPPRAEHTLGCAWWSGGMAPTEHELLAAAFLEVPAAPAPEGRHDSARH
jgi:hypothetical protein